MFTCRDSRGSPRVRDNPQPEPLSRMGTHTALSVRHVYEADQKCVGLKRDTETRRDVVSGQTEGNSVSVVEDVHRV